MKKSIIVKLLFFLFSLTNFLSAQFPQAYEQLITHNNSANFLKRLYNIRWIESFDVRPCIDQGISAWHKAHLEQDHEAKDAALIHMRAELIKALGAAKNYPSWITFQALEHIELEHAKFGYSRREFKNACKILVAAVAGAFVMYLLKNRSEAIWRDNVDYAEAKIVCLGEKLEKKIDAKFVTMLESSDEQIQKWRKEMKEDLKALKEEFGVESDYQKVVYKIAAAKVAGATAGAAAYGTAQTGNWLSNWWRGNSKPLTGADKKK